MKSKKDKHTKICLFICVIIFALFQITGCDTTKPSDNKAKVTINLITSTERDVNLAVGAILTLKNNDDNPDRIYIKEAEEDIVIFSDIPYGTYTLYITHDNFDDYSVNSFVIKTREVVYDAELCFITPDTMANVTVNFNLGEHFKPSFIRLQNKETSLFSVGEMISGTLYFTDIEFGIYSLTAPNNIIIIEEIVVNENNVIIDYDHNSQNHNFYFVTILNNTGDDFTRVTASEGAFYEIAHDGITIRINVTSSLPNSDSISFVWAYYHLNLRALSSAGQYTKWDIDFTQNPTVSLSVNDLDISGITHPHDLEDLQRFKFCAMVGRLYDGNDGIEISYLPLLSENYIIPELALEIDGQYVMVEEMPIFGVNIHYWIAYFDFNPGQTYQLRFWNNQAAGFQYDEIVYFTMGQDLTLNTPNFISDELIELSWTYAPNNNQDPDFQQITIKNTNPSWEKTVILTPEQRNYIITDTIFSHPEENDTMFNFTYINYGVSENISVRYNNTVSLRIIIQPQIHLF